MSTTSFHSTPFTFLLTDLVDSSIHWTAPSEMSAGLAEHDAIVTAAVVAHQGRIYKHSGDGIWSYFDSPVAAAECAVTIAADFRSGEYPLVEGLQIRTAVATGAVDVRGDEFFGPTLNRAARLCSVIHGGQVALSEETALLVRDFMPAGLWLQDLGEHDLRGLGHLRRIYQLNTEDSPTEFPPLRTARVAGVPLPAQHTSFHGRADDLRVLEDLLSTTRLITITGPAGVGKTRLAVELGESTRRSLSEGVAWCALAGVRDRELVAAAVLSAVGLYQPEGTTPREALPDLLSDRQMLLILDNCEHVVDEVAAIVGDILRPGGVVKVLTTSREALRLDGEQLYPLEPLGLPALSATEADDALLEQPAVELFISRARALRPQLPIDAATVEAARAICAAMGGLPLGIELAAGQALSTSPQDISALLEEGSLQELVSTRRDADRHRSIDRAIGWSYQLLSEQEQRFFERASVFVGGFDEGAANGVIADGVSGPDSARALRGLVAKSMVAGDSRRYSVLAPLAEYGRDRLEERSDGTPTRHRHLEYFHGLSQRLVHQLQGTEERAAANVFELEWPNLTAAFHHAVASGRAAAAVGIAAHATHYGFWRLRYEVADWCETALELPGGPSAPDADEAAGAAAVIRLSQGAVERCAALSRERADHPAEDSHWLPSLAMSLYHAISGSWSESRLMSERSIELAERAGDRFGTAIATSQLAVNAGLCDRLEEARIAGERAMDFARITGNPTAISYAASTLASVLDAREAERALALLDEGTRLAREVGNQLSRGVAARHRTTLTTRGAEPLISLGQMREQLDFWASLADSGQLWPALAEVASLMAEIGEDQAAAAIAQAWLASPWSKAHPERTRPDLEQIAARVAQPSGLIDLAGPELAAIAIREIDRIQLERQDTARVI